MADVWVRRGQDSLHVPGNTRLHLVLAPGPDLSVAFLSPDKPLFFLLLSRALKASLGCHL